MRSLVALLDLEQIEVNLFRGSSQGDPSVRVFGGEVAAQALVAAGRTVAEERPVHSLHAYFLRPGDTRRPIVYEVDRIRDGRSFTTRRVVAVQRGEAIFHLSASFHAGERGLEHTTPLPDVPRPEDLRPFDDWLVGPSPRRSATCGSTPTGTRWRSGPSTSRCCSPGSHRRTGTTSTGSRPPSRSRTTRWCTRAPPRTPPTCTCSVRSSTRTGWRTGGPRSSRRAWTTRCGSTGRCAPTSGCSTTRPATGPGPAAGSGGARSTAPTAGLVASVVQEGLLRLPEHRRPATS